MHPFKAFRTDIRLCIEAETGKHRISNARLYGNKKSHAEIIFVIVLKEASLLFVGKLVQIVRNVIRAEIDGGGDDRITDLFSLLVIVDKPILQSFDNISFVFGFDPPNIERLIVAVVCVADIENILEVVLISSSVDQSDTRCSSVHPTSKVTVPQLRFRTSGRVRSLSVDQNLVCKRVFVLIRCRVQKSSPRHRVRGDVFNRPLIQFGNQVYFSRHCFCSFF